MTLRTIPQISTKDASGCPQIGNFIQLQDDLPVEAFDEFFHRLAAAVVLSAILDAAGGSLARMRHKEDAITWLCDPENEDTWFSLAGVQRWRVLSWIQAGCKKDQLHKSQKGSGNKHKLHYSQYELKTEPKEEMQRPYADPDLGPEF